MRTKHGLVATNKTNKLNLLAESRPKVQQTLADSQKGNMMHLRAGRCQVLLVFLLPEKNKLFKGGYMWNSETFVISNSP